MYRKLKAKINTTFELFIHRIHSKDEIFLTSVCIRNTQLEKTFHLTLKTQQKHRHETLSRQQIRNTEAERNTTVRMPDPRIEEEEAVRENEKKEGLSAQRPGPSPNPAQRAICEASNHGAATRAGHNPKSGLWISYFPFCLLFSPEIPPLCSVSIVVDMLRESYKRKISFFSLDLFMGYGIILSAKI